MSRLTTMQLSIAEKASEDLYRYEKACEEHSAVLRRDPEGYAIAYEEYSTKSNEMGFMPARGDFDHYINESEKVLKKKCTNLLDHLHVVNASLFLSRLLMTKVSEHGEHVYLEFIRQKVALDKKYPYIFPESPASVQVATNPSPSDYPLVLPARSFKSDEIVGLARVPVDKTELIRYQRHPELLQQETFVSFNADDGQWEVFRISSFLTLDRDKIFYLVFADQGAEAVAWSNDDFFNLLCTSQRVFT